MDPDPNIIFFGLGLLFVFTVLAGLVVIVAIALIALIRYSNQELAKKMTAVFDKLKNSEKDLRQLAETHMSTKKELGEEIEKLRAELQESKGAKETQKLVLRNK